MTNFEVKRCHGCLKKTVCMFWTTADGVYVPGWYCARCAVTA